MNYKEYFYYMRDEHNHPRISVCLIKKNDMFHRGTAFCSFDDIICKKTGRDLARKRAVKAMMSRKNQLPIGGTDDVEIIINCCTNYKFIKNDIFEVPFKSQYNVFLSEFEEKMIKR